MTKKKESTSNVVNLFPLSESRLAKEFVTIYSGNTRYVSDWKRWMLYEGGMWYRDETLKVMSCAVDFCDDKSETLTKIEHKNRLLSSHMVRAMMSLACCNQRIAATVDQWDGESMDINCDGTVYNLGDDNHERPAIPGDYFTKSTDVRPQGDCPQWMEFLTLVTGGDAELMDYLQRMAGYCLTGSVEEQCLFFLYGPGGNGKSTFINTISRVMGDYAKTAALEMFTASRNDRHPTDLADLMGARLVTATETAGGRRWDETRIKILTGGDPIKARFMGADFFQYRPQFKLVISGNHKPSLDHVDDAMKRRVQIIPFVVKIEESQRIRGFEEVLKVEWPGILNWMIEGAVNWRTLGLAPPPAVVAATADYLDNEDVISMWLEECTDLVPGFFINRKKMFMTWMDWCEKAGEYPGTRRSFVQALRGRPGFEELKRNGERGWLGIDVKTAW